MKSKFAILALAASAVFLPGLSHAGPDADMDRSNPKAFVKDSAITTKIKAKLAAEQVTSLAKIHVDTDANGMVFLSGTARNQAQIDKAVMIAKAIERVRGVKSAITVKADD